MAALHGANAQSSRQMQAITCHISATVRRFEHDAAELSLDGRSRVG